MYVNYSALNAVRLGIKNTASQLKDGAKIVSKPLLVFLGK